MGAGTILYVHGAGNRGDQAKDDESRLRKKLKLSATSPKLKRSEWGDKKGPAAAMPRLDDALPVEVRGAAGLAAPVELADPLAPLKALAAPPGAGFAGVGSEDADTLLRLLAAGLVDTSDLGVSRETLEAAARRVKRSTHYKRAAGSEEAVFDATLRSVSAAAVQKAGLAAPAGFGPFDALGDIAGRIAQTLMGSGVLSVAGSWIASTLGPPAKLALSKHLAPRRAKFMHDNILVAADVLAYQRNGAAIREFVRGEIAACQPPVVALGHSLGGIILVDTLFETGAPATNVKLLVTFGSQSAFLQAIGGLGPLAPTPPWINIWTRYDFASFLAAKLFPGKARDVEVPIEIGFPDAHGAYYDTDGFYAAFTGEPVVKGILAP